MKLYSMKVYILEDDEWGRPRYTQDPPRVLLTLEGDDSSATSGDWSTSGGGSLLLNATDGVWRFEDRDEPTGGKTC